MKIQTLVHLLGVVICAVSCKNSSVYDKYSEEEAKKMLKTFYTDYINANSISDWKKSDSVIAKYCSVELINHINKLYSEPPAGDSYDKLLRSQMVDVKMLEKLSIQKDILEKNIYTVFIEYAGERWSIKLSIIKDKNNYKINRVL